MSMHVFGFECNIYTYLVLILCSKGKNDEPIYKEIGTTEDLKYVAKSAGRYTFRLTCKHKKCGEHDKLVYSEKCIAKL